MPHAGTLTPPVVVEHSVCRFPVAVSPVLALSSWIEALAVCVFNSDSHTLEPENTVSGVRLVGAGTVPNNQDDPITAPCQPQPARPSSRRKEPSCPTPSLCWHPVNIVGVPYLLPQLGARQKQGPEGKGLTAGSTQEENLSSVLGTEELPLPLGECISSFSVAITKYLRLNTLKREEVNSTHSSEGSSAYSLHQLGYGEGLVADGIQRQEGVQEGEVTWQDRKPEPGEGPDLLFYNNSLSWKL